MFLFESTHLLGRVLSLDSLKLAIRNNKNVDRNFLLTTNFGVQEIVVFLALDYVGFQSRIGNVMLEKGGGVVRLGSDFTSNGTYKVVQ